MPLVIGQILQGRYRILRQLGQGGMGAVYLAEDLRLGSRCAVKESTPDPSASPQALAQLRQQFQLEARVLASLNHPNLPKVTDYFSEAGNEYLVMEYVEGEDLANALARHGKPLPEKPVLLWADQVLDALEYLHGRQPNPIIHRDIKPANIVLTPQGKVKLVDFGLVKLYDPNRPGTATAIQGKGTPEYTPLEQYGGSAQHTDARTDIYALGATLYHLLTGATPPLAIERVLDPSRLVPPRQLNPALSAATETALLKALALQPDQRFQSVREMRRALSRALTGMTPPVGPAPAHKWLWMGGVGLALLLIAALVFRSCGFSNPRPTPTPAPVVTPTARPGPTATPVAPTAPVPVWITPGPAELTATAVFGTIEALTRMPTHTPTSKPTVTLTPDTSLRVLTPSGPLRATEAIAPTVTATSISPSVTPTVPSPIWLNIPTGDFVMGSSETEIEIALSECNATEGQETGQPCQRGWFNEPQRLVHVNGFKITKHEITNAQYKVCEAAGVCAKAGRIVTDNNIRYDSGYFADDYPVMAVNWYDAATYCGWIGGRLPTEAEWEYAARGTDGRRYPWGNTFNPSRANLQTNFPSPVGSYPAGASPFGVLDMAGNVFEWTATEVNGNYVVRGGSWAKYYFRGRTTDRGTQLSPAFANYDIGFRCVR